MNPFTHQLSNYQIEYPWCYKHDIFTPEELTKIIQQMDELELFESTVYDQKAYQINTDVRRSKTSALHPEEPYAWIFQRLSQVIQLLNIQFYQYDLYGFDFIQYAEYRAGERGKYDWHMDSLFAKANDTPGLFRKLSASVMLNDDFEGGKFQFTYGGAKEDHIDNVEFRPGTIVVFPSYLTHRVTEVTKGCRKSLVVWTMGPKFR